MQQKFLEEKIGAHRKSKKALSAKQRTAKKAGREFPEEDAEQLKHVTEQQGVVQKQLELVSILSPLYSYCLNPNPLVYLAEVNILSRDLQITSCGPNFVLNYHSYSLHIYIQIILTDFFPHYF